MTNVYWMSGIADVINSQTIILNGRLQKVAGNGYSERVTRIGDIRKIDRIGWGCDVVNPDQEGVATKTLEELTATDTPEPQLPTGTGRVCATPR